jgi:hypothetical protein
VAILVNNFDEFWSPFSIAAMVGWLTRDTPASSAWLSVGFIQVQHSPQFSDAQKARRHHHQGVTDPSAVHPGFGRLGRYPRVRSNNYNLTNYR